MKAVLDSRWTERSGKIVFFMSFKRDRYVSLQPPTLSHAFNRSGRVMGSVLIETVGCEYTLLMAQRHHPKHVPPASLLT
jgi:hypothetical protein